MSKKIWKSEDFKSKNEIRKIYKEKDHNAYLQGRRLRKQLTTNGCFGNFDAKQYNEVSIGTSGNKN